MIDNTAEFHIGCYSKAIGGKPAQGEGIYSARIDLNTGALSDRRCVAHCVNPSYLAWGPGRHRLYATQETAAADGPGLASFEKVGAGQLQQLQTISLEGEFPCHVAVDTSGRYLTSAQYGSGDVALFSLDGNGNIDEPAQMIRYSGRGANQERQEGPHTHYATVLSQQGLLVVVDLGIDSVFAHQIDPATGSVDEHPSFSLQTAPGAGPRHLAFLPGSDTAYLYCELEDEIYQLTLDAGGFNCAGTTRTFEHCETSGSAGAAIKIAPDQRHLYVSGRTHSQIATFAIDQGNRRLTARGQVDSGGISPRDFSITPDGSFLVVANEESNTVTSLRRDIASGFLESTGYSLKVGSPVCVLF